MTGRRKKCPGCSSTIDGWMNYCAKCGREVVWHVTGADECLECGAPAAAAFNHCWSCGADFYEGNDARRSAKGFTLKWDCDDECGGAVGYLMSFCPWCGGEQDWWPSDDEEADLPDCDTCDSTVGADWRFCAFCGESISKAAAVQKPLGTCPYCTEKVRAVVVEGNTVRRDVLTCPKCEERVLICMGPGCKNYAAGGDLYDHNLCPECTATGIDAAGKIAVKAAVTAVGILVKGKLEPKK